MSASKGKIHKNQSHPKHYMKIKTIKSQSRRDFTATYECEHCGKTSEGSGYDDANFHENVMPNMECKSCGKKADEKYRPLATKYQSWEVV